MSFIKIISNGSLYIEKLFNSFLFVFGRCIFLIKNHWSRESREIVLIKTWGGIGDYILLTASLSGYRKIFPKAHIILMCRHSNRDFVIHNQDIDSAFFVNYNHFRKSPIERIKVCIFLSRQLIKTYINADYSTTNEKLDNYVLDWINAKDRITFQCNDQGAHRNYDRYSVIVPQTNEWMFEIQRNNEILEYFGYESSDSIGGKIWNIEGYTPVNKAIKNYPAQNYYIVFPGSLLEKKQWPAKNFAQLIEKISYFNLQPIICGNRSDKVAGRLISKLAKISVTDFTGKTSLMDLAYLIKNAAFLISNDTSAAHIAAAVGTPACVILGGGHYGRFLPYPHNNTIIPIINEEYKECFRCYWNCKYEDTRCVKDISVEEVKNKLDFLYNNIFVQLNN